MKGYLKTLLLSELNSEPCNGYCIMSKIESKTGKKPSSGSIYPILKELESNKLISSKTNKNSKYYSLTKKGEQYLNQKIKEKEKSIIKSLEVMHDVISNKDYKLIEKSTKKIFEKKIHLKNLDTFLEFKKEFHELIMSKDFDNKEQDFIKIIKSTTKKFRELKNETN